MSIRSLMGNRKSRLVGTRNTTSRTKTVAKKFSRLLNYEKNLTLDNVNRSTVMYWRLKFKIFLVEPAHIVGTTTFTNKLPNRILHKVENQMHLTSSPTNYTYIYYYTKYLYTSCVINGSRSQRVAQ